MSAMTIGAAPETRRDRITARAQADDPSRRIGAALTALGGGILRYGLVGILLYLGAFKFTATEAQAIEPLIANSPLMSWLYLVTGLQGASNVIGAAEIVIAVLLAIRPFSPRATAIGSIGAILMFLATLSFLATTPGMWAYAPDFPLPLPSEFGFFILKDVFLLGAAVWSAGEALEASARR
jgi:reactive chlorine resistance protein C